MQLNVRDIHNNHNVLQAVDPDCFLLEELLMTLLFCPTLFAQWEAVTLNNQFINNHHMHDTGAVASWLVHTSPDQAVRVGALARDIVMCSLARHLTLAVPPAPRCINGYCRE